MEAGEGYTEFLLVQWLRAYILNVVPPDPVYTRCPSVGPDPGPDGAAVSLGIGMCWLAQNFDAFGEVRIPTSAITRWGELPLIDIQRTDHPKDASLTAIQSLMAPTQYFVHSEAPGFDPQRDTYFHKVEIAAGYELPAPTLMSIDTRDRDAARYSWQECKVQFDIDLQRRVADQSVIKELLDDRLSHRGVDPVGEYHRLHNEASAGGNPIAFPGLRMPSASRVRIYTKNVWYRRDSNVSSPPGLRIRVPGNTNPGADRTIPELAAAVTGSDPATLLAYQAAALGLLAGLKSRAPFQTASDQDLLALVAEGQNHLVSRLLAESSLRTKEVVTAAGEVEDSLQELLSDQALMRESEVRSPKLKALRQPGMDKRELI